MGRLNDIDTKYVLGEKTMLVIIACPVEYQSDCDAGYADSMMNYQSLSDYDDSIETYMGAVYVEVNKFFDVSSWGQFSVVPTFVYAPVDYSVYDCGTVNYWDYYLNQASTSVDMMAIAYAATQKCVNAATTKCSVDDFDFWQIILPTCPALGWSAQAPSRNNPPLPQHKLV